MTDYDPNRDAPDGLLLALYLLGLTGAGLLLIVLAAWALHAIGRLVL